jgi:hypothetical protein
MNIICTNHIKFELIYHFYNEIPYIVCNEHIDFGISPKNGFLKTEVGKVIVDGVDDV